MSYTTTLALNQTGRAVSRLYARLAIRLDLELQAPLAPGAKIIAANHPTTTDPFLMMGLTGEPIYILITDMCFQMPLLGGFLRGAGHIPVVAGSGRAAFDAAVGLLQQGKSVGIFPEGALSPIGGGLCPPHTGVARLALATGAPVLPAGIALQWDHVTYREARGGDTVDTARLYVGGPYAVTIGRPLHLAGDGDDRVLVQRSAQGVMDAIASLARASALRLPDGRLSEPATALVPAIGRS